MMDDLHNNINVWHGTTKISICQHWDSPSDRIGGTAAMQEVGIIPDDDDWSSMRTERFGKSLTHLIKVLEGIRDEIDQQVHNESSGKGNARATQSATGSTT